MQYLSMDEIRGRYLSFFEARGHLRMPSFPLVPQNDNSLLLVSSGMVPFKPYFTGMEIPPSKRVTTCQRCIRTTDIDEVGYDVRHGSFFEMLGNFSFGDYFKKECIPWAWEFVTEVLEIPREKLWISVYLEDDEAYEIWNGDVGIPKERIVRLGKEDNFWEVGLGPCGPCSEIHFDRGAENGCGKPDCAVGCDCDRFMEIWNLVFTQFDKREDGSYAPLENKNIDTGMGLDRVSMLMQNTNSIFEVDTMKTLRKKVMDITGASEETQDKRTSVSIIADHIKSVSFMAADGVLPSNEGRGYVLRRLLRRAVRHARLFGYSSAFVADLARAVIEGFGGAYPELNEKSDYINLVLTTEESRFMETLDTGMVMLSRFIGDLRSKNETVMKGSDAFLLYDTYGFPLELTREILAEEGFAPDEGGFADEMERQRERARAARGATNFMGSDETVYHRLEPGLTKEFAFHSNHTVETRVAAIVACGEIRDAAKEGDEVSIFLRGTPFYFESGGQKGDAGLIQSDSATVEIYDCLKVAGGNAAHIGKIIKGALRSGDKVTASVDRQKRVATARNHTATHLLQKALREVLGTHVEQSGSEVSAERLRFDFTHFAPMTRGERDKAESRVNELIFEGIKINISEMPLAEARRKGATALFGEKYGETVRVVDIGGVSVELCGGTHLSDTQSVGLFKLLSENGIAAGVRRVEGLTGPRALNYYREAEAQLLEASGFLKITPDKLSERIQSLSAENKSLQRELSKIKSESAANDEADRIKNILNSSYEHNGIKIAVSMLDGFDMNALRLLSDKLRERVDAFLLCGVSDGAVQFIAGAADETVKKGFHAGQVVKTAASVCGGGGGGRANAAQAGGKDVTRASEALDAGLACMKEQLK